MSQHRHALATNSALKVAGFCRNISGPSHKESPNITRLQAFFILCVFLERNRRRGSPISLSSALVLLVSPNRGRAWEGLCLTCSNRLRTSSNAVKNKSTCKIWQGKKYYECEQETLLNSKQYEGKKTLCAGGKIILTRHNGVKNLRPLLSLDRTTQTHQLVTCRINGRNSRIGGKVV